jgi:hypothetical protein
MQEPCTRSVRVRLRLSLGLLSALLLGACAATKAQRTSVMVRAEADPGVPLSSVTVLMDGRPLGASDAQGALPLALEGQLGESIRLDVACPNGHRLASTPLRVVLRPVERRAPEYRVSCPPSRRWMVVAVRAKNAVNVPLRYLDNIIGRTDRDGIAHGLVALAPGERAKFVLDTSAPEHRYLRPQSPSLQLSVPDRDEVVLLEQPFVLDAPKKAAPRGPELPIHF